jgi:hypothetical protein
MVRAWLIAAVVGIPAIAGVVSVLKGWGFRKGVRLGWRLALVGIVFFWLSVFNILGAFVASGAPAEETVMYWLHHLTVPLGVSFWWIGICRFWGAACRPFRMDGHNGA